MRGTARVVVYAATQWHTRELGTALLDSVSRSPRLFHDVNRTTGTRHERRDTRELHNLLKRVRLKSFSSRDSEEKMDGWKKKNLSVGTKNDVDFLWS